MKGENHGNSQQGINARAVKFTKKLITSYIIF